MSQLDRAKQEADRVAHQLRQDAQRITECEWNASGRQGKIRIVRTRTDKFLG